MTPNEILGELEKLATRLGVGVRFEPFDPRVLEGRGGLCKLRGKPIVVVDAHLPTLDKIGVLVEALAAFDLEAIYVPPALRARIESRGRPLRMGEGRGFLTVPPARGSEARLRVAGGLRMRIVPNALPRPLARAPWRGLSARPR